MDQNSGAPFYQPTQPNPNTGISNVFSSDYASNGVEKAYDIEEMNGIRFSWQYVPTNIIDSSEIPVPMGFMYTPLKKIPNRGVLEYEPVYCHTCGAILNPCATINYSNHTWYCPMCKTVCPLPSTYHQMTPTNVVAEILPGHTTVEYSIPNGTPFRPVFLFVVDICNNEKEHNHLKNLLLKAIATLPQNCMVGLITFGTLCSIHELRFNECPRNYVFNGNKTYLPNQIQQFLSYYPSNPESPNNFIVPYDEAEQMLNTFIETLEQDPFTVQKGERASRCTGAALSLAVSFIDAIYPGNGGQILLFSSGPITKGPGAMASMKKAEIVRQHKEIESGKAPLTGPSLSFFSGLSQSANEKNITVNIVSASFEESGLYEMNLSVIATGGFMIAGESWSEENLTQSLIKYFDGGVYSNSGYKATIEFNCSPCIRIKGCIGPCMSTDKKSQKISDKGVGASGTDQWKVSSISPFTTFAFFFEVGNLKNNPIPVNEIACIQMVTRYSSLIDGSKRIRVTTIPLLSADLQTQKPLFIQSFDYECGAVLLSRLSMWKIRHEDPYDVLRFIDKSLINISRMFGSFTKGKPDTLSLPQPLLIYPQLVYHLRRSPFLSTFNSSPDQTTALRYSLISEDITNSLLMIQPTLIKYTIGAPSTPVLLDTSSLNEQSILVLDTYFRVLIWHGSTIASWRDQNYQEQEDYQNLKTLLNEPMNYANQLVSERFPTPGFVTCDQDSSLSRYLLTRCNPSSTPFSSFSKGESLGTDEPSYEKFFDKLRRVTVS